MSSLFFLATAIASLVFPSPSFALCGDANHDSAVTVTDGVQALRSAADLPSECSFYPNCDVDSNGAVSVTDGVNILRAAADLPSPCDDIPATCGNGTVDATEDCEIYDDVQIGGLCGFGTIQANVCSEGFLCRVNCQCQPATCGNCVLEKGEACDDFNTMDGDGCSSDCLIECGSAKCGPGEVCSLDKVCRPR